MKKQLLFSFLALFGAITFSAHAQVGNTCDNPIIINALPFQASGNTADYGDDVDLVQGTLCGAVPSNTNYLAGNEVFYSYTATENVPVSFVMTPGSPTSTNSGIFVYEGCANVGVSCVAGLANSNANVRTVTASLLAGHTYIIAIASGPSTQTILYNLIIQKELCSPKPSGLAADNITTTSASLAWFTNLGATSSEIAIQLAGSIIPQGPGVAATNQLFEATNLTPATEYQFWVRDECETGSGIFTPWAGPYLFNTLICDATAACNYVFRMTDSANNGWNGARMQVRQNGIVVATIGSTYNLGSGPG
ncbi:hypothetical protein [Flavobacterium sp. 3HN19-14]|uniref:hypothetical protein n=1 Tax=Flavobacterium sp. 3HN19-14 TaxID=3448133 RepID=UPI003EE2A682